MNKKIPLYCECGGLFKTKSKQIKSRPTSLFNISVSKSVNYYKCTKCGKIITKKGVKQ